MLSYLSEPCTTDIIEHYDWLLTISDATTKVDVFHFFDFTA